MDQGSFASASGGITPELQQAISRRQGSQTQAVTQGAPTFDPSQQVPNQPPSPMGFSPVSGGAVPSQSPTGMPQSPESQIIIGALNTRLKSISKQEEAQTIPPAPQAGPTGQI